MKSYIVLASIKTESVIIAIAETLTTDTDWVTKSSPNKSISFENIISLPWRKPTESDPAIVIEWLSSRFNTDSENIRIHQIIEAPTNHLRKDLQIALEQCLGFEIVVTVDEKSVSIKSINGNAFLSLSGDLPNNLTLDVTGYDITPVHVDAVTPDGETYCNAEFEVTPDPLYKVEGFSAEHLNRYLAEGLTILNDKGGCY